MKIITLRRGYSLGELADLFEADRRTIAKRVRDLQPLGRRAGHPTYGFAAAARAILAPYGAHGDPDSLAPHERRAHFQAINEKIKVDATTARLVSASEAAQDFAEMVETVVPFIQKLPLILQREVGLDGAQVARCQKACDTIRQRMYERVVLADSDADAGTDAAPETNTTEGDEA